MQPPTAPPREHLTTAQVEALIRDTPGLTVAAGCDLLDMDLGVIADITDLFAGGTVTRQSYATLHGSAALGIETELDWGAAIVRPYMLLSSGAISARFNLGAYFTSTPEVKVGTSPVIYDVQGYDILDGLNSPVGEVYAVPAGAGYLATVETILDAQGYTQYVIDQAAAGKVLPSPRVDAMDENTTWLTVVNGLLGSVGYQGIWSDWDGRLRVQPYVAPAARAAEWTYDTGLLTSMLAKGRTIALDLYRAPNRWVFYRSNNVDGPAPVEGDGIFTYTNVNVGRTSVQARHGRVTTRPVPLDVADHEALVAAAGPVIDADMRVHAKVTLNTAPNPLHWHFDRIRLTDPDIAASGEVLVSSWTLPLNGADMSHEWSLL